jgi:lysozyme family protein
MNEYQALMTQRELCNRWQQSEATLDRQRLRALAKTQQKTQQQRLVCWFLVGLSLNKKARLQVRWLGDLFFAALRTPARPPMRAWILALLALRAAF